MESPQESDTVDISSLILKKKCKLSICNLKKNQLNNILEYCLNNKLFNTGTNGEMEFHCLCQYSATGGHPLHFGWKKSVY